jgi:glutathione synthase/RimK-type ligase-like ATP-grasp enzyme
MVTPDARRPISRDSIPLASRPHTASSRSTILVLSGNDATTEAVTAELRRRGSPVICFDPASFPIEAKLTAWSDGQAWKADISSSGIDLSFDDIGSVWYRRPPVFRFHPDMNSEARHFADREAQVALGSLVRSLDCLWVNHPDKAKAAEYQLLQFRLSAEVGFKVPRSIITNDSGSALSFFDQCGGRVVYKPLSGTNLPTDEETGPLSVHTSIVQREHLLQLSAAVSATPCLFQEYIQKETELRLTIIGGEVFPVQIDSQHAPECVVDRRRGYEHLRYRVCQLPQDIREKCLQLAHRLGLLFATVDLAVTPESEYVFLGINPSGKWLWLESATGLPMTHAMADLLSGAVPADGSIQ